MGFLILLAVGLLSPAALASDDLPPPKVIDRKTGKVVRPRATPVPKAAPKPAEQPKPAPKPEDCPTAPSGKAPPSALQAAPVQADTPVWTTPRDQEAWARGCPDDAGGIGDTRKQVPVPLRFSVSYAFAADETATNTNTTKSSDTLDVQMFYAVNDRLTVGAMARWLLTPDAFALGPLVHYEVRKETRTTPSVGVGGFLLLGEHEQADRRLSLYAAASKDLELPFTSNLLRGAAVHAGGGYSWRDQDLYYDGWEWWVRGVVKLPERFSLYVEAYRGCACTLNLATGLRWSSPWGIDFTLTLYDCVGERIGYRGALDGVEIHDKLRSGDASRGAHDSVPAHDSGQSNTNRVENDDDDDDDE